MELQTKINVRKGELEIGHGQKLLLMGSCFADNIGERLSKCGFDCLRNPFGTLYNPASIAKNLRLAMKGERMDADSPEIFRDGDVWHSWMHHSRFSASTCEELLNNVNASLQQTAERLVECDVLIVTFGSAYIYRYRDTGEVVANCHKVSDKLFVRERLDAGRIASDWSALIEELREKNRNMKVLLTVSPIRHKRDGLHANQLSKSVLLLAVDELCAAHPDVCVYFPSYEIVMDELRDYRFYAEDMVHPSPLAVEIIWERFREAFFSGETCGIADEWRKINAALEHRPFNPDSEEYRRFRERIEERMERLKSVGKKM